MRFRVKPNINYWKIINDDVNIKYKKTFNNILYNSDYLNILDNPNFRNNQNYIISEKNKYNHNYWEYKSLIYILIYVFLLFMTFPLVAKSLLIWSIYFLSLFVSWLYLLIFDQKKSDKKNKYFFISETYHNWFFIHSADKKNK